jgi:hypothetical protein
MGVTDNRREIFFSQNSISRNEESSSDDGWEIINNESPDDVPPSPPPPITTAQRNPLPPKKKQQPRGNGLTLKKGRRSVHRYMEEKHLFQSYLEEEGVLDDNPEGWDIGYRDSKSHFSSLLNGNNESLLNDFVNDCEKIDRLRNKSTKRRRQNSLHDEYLTSEDDDLNDPEYAFLSISQNLRHALKKHLPLGMLEGLENEIIEFFTANPHTKYISSELSSYERLLVHAASSYNQLCSRSFDENGKRILLVQNRKRNGTFSPVDPSLTQYLKMKSNIQ